MQLFGLDLPNGRGQVGGDADEFWRALHPDDKHMMAEFHRTADEQEFLPLRISYCASGWQHAVGLRTREGGGPWSRR